MGNRYKVIQWATGITGQASLRAVIRNPNLELVAVKVYSPDKDGKDAGQLLILTQLKSPALLTQFKY